MNKLTVADIKPGTVFTVENDIVGTEENGCAGYVFLKAGQLATIEEFMGLEDDAPEEQFFQALSDTNDDVVVCITEIVKVK